MVSISVLDLVMIGEGKGFPQSLHDTLCLAQHVEQHGYNRFWVAEHHNMPGIASSATPLIMSHLAAGTSTLRVGSGGVMLHNHSPLIVAEQFATLNALYPGRIDLGLGRAPGANPATVLAVRRGLGASREFADDVAELSDYLLNTGKRPVRAVPGHNDVPIWILGSGFYGARLAASRGLPFVFASHFSPRYLLDAIAEYRSNFRPSEQLDQPYVMAGVNVFAADSHDEAVFLASSHQQWVANVHAGRPGLLPKPVENYMDMLPDGLRHGVEQELSCTAVGSKLEVEKWLRRFVEQTGVDELMVDSRIYDSQARCRSYQLAAEALN